MRITQHFHLDEFAQRPWSGDKDGEPYPDGDKDHKGWIRDRLTPLCQALEVLREELGGRPFHILSGYRSPEFNRAIKGAPLSEHCQGRACDFQVAGVPAVRVHAVAWQLIHDGRIPQIGGIGRYATFTHLDVRPRVTVQYWPKGSKVADWTPSES